MDSADAGASYVTDYRQTVSIILALLNHRANIKKLTELNQICLQTLSDWSERILGIQFSAQVVYNLPMDMLSNVPYVNAPECETLAFLGSVNGYRQFAGPANLAGKRIISSELGAVFS